jgi:hypothetical protein
VIGCRDPHQGHDLGPADLLLAERGVDPRQREELAADGDQLPRPAGRETEPIFGVLRRGAVTRRLMEAALLHLGQVEGQHPLAGVPEPEALVETDVDFVGGQSFVEVDRGKGPAGLG